jgi:hypothetical protein
MSQYAHSTTIIKNKKTNRTKNTKQNTFSEERILCVKKTQTNPELCLRN